MKKTIFTIFLLLMVSGFVIARNKKPKQNKRKANCLNIPPLRRHQPVIHNPHYRLGGHFRRDNMPLPLYHPADMILFAPLR